MPMRDEDRIDELQEHVSGLLLAVTDLLEVVDGLASEPAAGARVERARLALAKAESRAEQARILGEKRWRTQLPPPA